jgi:selenocysteine lyase/cysteine desulfurase
LHCLITDDLIKEEFPQFNDTTWFGTGILGVMPKSAVKTLTEAMMRYETELFFKYHEIEAEVEVLRHTLASLINAGKANEICFTRNANEGIIIAIPKCIMHTPMEWENSSGNTTFSMEGHKWDKVSEYLSKQWRIIVRGMPEVNGIRISTSYYNTHAELDKLIKALKEL